MASPFVGEIFPFVNPDGTEVTLRGWGNQFEAVFETLDGFTVVKAEDGYYEYAKLADDGQTLVPSGTRVGEADAEALLLPKHVRPTREATRAQTEAAQEAMGTVPRWMERRREEQARRIAQPPEGLPSEGAPEGPGGAPPSTSTTGDYRGLVLLIDFSDFPQTIGRQEVDDFCNKAGYSGFGNNGSAFDYFRDVSDGKLLYKNHVAAYVRAAHPRTYYTDPAIAYGTRAQELIREALDSLVASGFDFSTLTADSGGFIRALSVFYAGVRSNAWSQGLWPHAWGLASTYAVGGGRRFRDYQITDLGNQLTLRTFCHENGHMVCDFPDLYDYDQANVGYGVGHYSLMCYGGADKNPTQVDAYLKHAAGWASRVTTLGSGITATVDAGKNDFLIHAKNASEYFILENRQKSGRDATLPDAGVAVWHVDVNGNNSNEQMTASQHYELSLEQADGRFDLEHRANTGDADDLYGDAATTFGAATAPNSNWWDGSASGLEIEHISAVGASMTVATRGAVATTATPTAFDADHDLTGDGTADVVGFGEAGMYVALNNGDGTFQPLQLAVTNFGYTAGGWRVEKHPRFLADLTGDGTADVVGFGEAGMYVALNNGDGTFQPLQLAVTNFGYTAGGWRVEKHPRFLADLTGDGTADVVGFGEAGMYVALNNGDGTFQPLQLAVTNFGYTAGGWRVEKHPRFLADLTGDGTADVVGFGEAGMYVALNNGDGTFQPLQLAVTNFGYTAGGWRVEKHPRFLADLTGDGTADVVGFGEAGMYVALNNGDGTFQPLQLAVTNFGYTAGGWRVEKHPRFLADLTGDGTADVVGFGEAGMYVALNNGDGTFQPLQLAVTNFGYTAGGWRVEKHPRFLAHLTGDAAADTGGFGEAGMYVALNNGDGTFQPLQLAVTNFGYTAGGWRVDKHPRLVAGPGSVGV